MESTTHTDGASIVRASHLDRFVQNHMNGPFATMWSDSTWPLEATRTIIEKSQGFVTFAAGSMEDEPFTGPFADLARALVSAFDQSKLRKPTMMPYRQLMTALRHLYSTIDPASFDATKLDGATFTAAHGRSAGNGAGRSNRIGTKLEWIAGTLKEAGITCMEPWSYARRKESKSPSQGDLLDEVQLRALARVSSVDLAPSDRLVQCAVELMLICGFRVGEAISLPRDTWCEEAQIDENGEPLRDENNRPMTFYGLRYWAEKTGAGVAMIKALPSWIVPRARWLVETALALTERERGIAAHQAMRGRTTLGREWDDLPCDALMSDADIVRALDLAVSPSGFIVSGKRWLTFNRVAYVKSPDPTRNPWCVRWLARKSDVYEALMRASFNDNCRPDRRYEPVALHELLFIKRYRDVAGTSRMITHGDVEQHLGSDRPSIFDRHGITDDGKKIKIRPKQFRSSLNVAAIRGGLSDVMVARHFGREIVALNDAYDRRDDAEKEQELRDRMEIGGFIQAMEVPMRPPLPKSAPLVKPGRAAHLTTLGICYHSFAEKPCAAHLKMVAAGFDDAALDPSSDDGWRLLQAIEDQLAEASRESTAYGREAWVRTTKDAMAALRSVLVDHV